MFKSGKPFLDRQTDEPEDHDQAEVEVANDRPAHQTAALVLTADARRDPQRGRVRPRDALELKF